MTKAKKKPFDQLQYDKFNRWFNFLLKMCHTEEQGKVLFQAKGAMWKCWLNEAEKKQ